VTRLFRVAVLIGAGLAGSTSAARADILVTPFVGKTFGASTTFPTAERVDSQKWTVGGAAGWLGASFLGAEIDFGYAPRFFNSDPLLNRPGSNVTTFTGNLILAVPLSVTRDSLRPYATAGMGVLHASATDQADINIIDRNLVAVSVGGGVIGFLNRRAGVRFDVRRIRSASTEVDRATGESEPRLGFWRATLGVALRY
jgi:hypothetical protein